MTTKVPIELSSTPSINDGGNATAITIDSSEKVTIANDLESTWASSADRFIGMKFSTTYALGMNLLESGREVRINAKAADTGGMITFGTGTSYNERMRIDGSGNVGIGDSSPHSFGTNQSGLTISDGTGGCIRLKNDAGSVNFDIENGGGAGVKLNSVNAFPLIFATSDTERIRIDSSGNLLIGATSTNTGGFGSVSPQLLVAGTMPQVALHETDNDKDGYIGIQGSVMFIQTADAIPMRFATSDTERMRIASNGSIGMGTTPPTDTHTGWTQLFIGQKGSIISENDTGVHGLDGTFVTDNMYVDSDTGAFAYIEANESSAYRQEAGNHQFFTQASGSAGAAVTLSEKMRIASDGKVGIGCTPGYDFEVRTNDTSTEPQQVIRQLGTGDAALGFQIPSANNWYIGVDNSDSDIFKIGSGLTVGTTSHLNINSSGDVMIGRSSTVAAEVFTVQASGSSTNCTFFKHATTDDRSIINTIHEGSTGSTSRFHFVTHNVSGVAVGSISANGSSTAYNTSSDYRLKENVDYDWDATTRLKQLKPARFNFIIDETNTLVDGFLAHEVSGIVPEAITGEKDAVDGEGNPQYQGIDQSKLVPLLVKTIQELEARITALES